MLSPSPPLGNCLGAVAVKIANYGSFAFVLPIELPSSSYYQARRPVCVYLCVHVCVYVCMYVCMSVCLFVFV